MQQFDHIPTVKELSFFFLMSPDYGSQAAATLPNGKTVFVVKHGSLHGVMPDPYAGYYDIGFLGDLAPRWHQLPVAEANVVLVQLSEGS